MICVALGGISVIIRATPFVSNARFWRKSAHITVPNQTDTLLASLKRSKQKRILQNRNELLLQLLNQKLSKTVIIVSKFYLLKTSAFS